MDQYNKVSYEVSKLLTSSYSTSFSMSAKLFPLMIRMHIYAIYGLVRIADEIVDSYRGSDMDILLEELEKDTYRALSTGYSVNPTVQSFAQTARQYGIDKELIIPFFKSMAMDINKTVYTKEEYATYIHGSAEVIGLMCLQIFCLGNTAQYESLITGASALGSAYQKVNFLRDIGNDYKELGRFYFPGLTYDNFGNNEMQAIIKDIEDDFAIALPAINSLPKSCRPAVMTSYSYYKLLLERIKNSTADTVKNNRIRIPDRSKLLLLSKAVVKKRYAS